MIHIDRFARIPQNQRACAGTKTLGERRPRISLVGQDSNLVILYFNRLSHDKIGILSHEPTSRIIIVEKPSERVEPSLRTAPQEEPIS